MGLFNKLKDVLFDEEVIEEEVEVKEPKKEIKVQKEETPKVENELNFKDFKEPVKEEVKPVETDRDLFKNEKAFGFPFDDDFDDFEPVKEEVKKQERPTRGVNLIDYDRRDDKVRRDLRTNTTTSRSDLVSPVTTNKGRVYSAESTREIGKRKFKPSVVISPVYGVLNQDYTKEDIQVLEKPKSYDVDEVRKRAFGTLEKQQEESLVKESVVTIEKEEPIKEIPRRVEVEIPQLSKPIKKEEVEEKEIIFDDNDFEDENTLTNINIEEDIKDVNEVSSNDADDLINELNNISEEENKTETSSKTNEELDNDLFDLIDSMYEDKED